VTTPYYVGDVSQLQPPVSNIATDANLTAIAGDAGASPPALATSASGLLGWLRKINDTLAGSGGGPSSSVSISQATPGTTNGVVVNNTSLAITAASLPLPSGAATDSNNNTIAGAAGTSPPALAASASGLIGWLRKIVDTLTGSIAVTGTFWQATQPVSGTFWQATQPVSGTVTANAGTNLNTSALALDATLTGGTQKSKITDGTNDAAVKAASTAAVAADKAVVVAVCAEQYGRCDRDVLAGHATCLRNILAGNPTNLGGIAASAEWCGSRRNAHGRHTEEQDHGRHE
jgi:hypothetical protein